MQVFTLTKHLKSFLKSFSASQNIGFVPTMGALHNGHLSLVENSIGNNDVTIVSIFVNPTQFDKPEDLIKYPRDLQADLELLESFHNNIVVFAPSPKMLYGEEIYSTVFDFGGVENEMEGAFRSGHFDGVGTVLSLFFEIIHPTNAYFGEKDFQQLQIIKKLVEIKGYNIDIIGCPIYREANGLAYSSRNKRLSIKSKETCSFIYDTLKHAKTDFGIKSAKEITAIAAKAFEKHPLFDLEYFIIAETKSLKTAFEIKPNEKYRAFVATFVEGVRLIDNIALN